MAQATEEIAQVVERVRFLLLAVQGFEECVALAKLASRLREADEHPAVRGVLVGITACYGRIFKGSDGLAKLGGTDYEKPPTEELREAHRFLMSLRDKRHMHLDADPKALSRRLGERGGRESWDPEAAFPVIVWLNEAGDLVLEPEMADLNRLKLPDVVALALFQLRQVEEELQPLLDRLVSVSSPLERGTVYKLGESFPLLR